MTTITLDLPDALVQRAGQAARVMHRTLPEVLTVMLQGALPALDDVPPQLQAELLEMTWLDDQSLLEIAKESMSPQEQAQLAKLSMKTDLGPDEQAMLESLRAHYGELTLRKARALALMSVRSGKGLLGAKRAN